VNTVRIYPNPARDKVFISFAQPINTATLQILGIDGKLIRQMQRGYMFRNEQLPVGDLHSGTYLLRINTGAKIYQVKFVKQ
jgi:hypothetical protein